MLILGVDPGTVALGYGLVSSQGSRLSAVEYGVLPALSAANAEPQGRGDGPRLSRTPQTPRGGTPGSRRGEGASVAITLRQIYQGVKEVLSRWQPDAVAVEELFFCRNTRSAMTVGQARGVVLLAAAEADLEILEFTPLEVKVAVTGYGRAEKRQVQYMVRALLSLQETPRPDDAADALAVAICGQRYLSGAWRDAWL